MSSDPYLNSFRPGEGFPSGVEYRWSDGASGEAMSVSAPVYIEKVLGWIADQVCACERMLCVFVCKHVICETALIDLLIKFIFSSDKRRKEVSR